MRMLSFLLWNFKPSSQKKLSSLKISSKIQKSQMRACMKYSTSNSRKKTKYYDEGIKCDNLHVMSCVFSRKKNHIHLFDNFSLFFQFALLHGLLVFYKSFRRILRLSSLHAPTQSSQATARKCCAKILWSDCQNRLQIFRVARKKHIQLLQTKKKSLCLIRHHLTG